MFYKFQLWILQDTNLFWADRQTDRLTDVMQRLYCTCCEKS